MNGVWLQEYIHPNGLYTAGPKQQIQNIQHMQDIQRLCLYGINY